MARPKNTVQTVQITISTTKPVWDNLQDLVNTGLFGKSPAEAAERLIAKGIQELQKEELIAGKSKKTDQQKLLWRNS